MIVLNNFDCLQEMLGRSETKKGLNPSILLSEILNLFAVDLATGCNFTLCTSMHKVRPLHTVACM